MKIEGRLTKTGKWWAVSIPALRIDTQGASRKDAMEMAGDAVRMHAEDLGVDISFVVEPGKGDTFYIASGDVRGLIAFVLKRQRQRAGYSVRDVARHMGSGSPNAYARYELGSSEPTISKLDEIFDAMLPGARLTITISGV